MTKYLIKRLREEMARLRESLAQDLDDATVFLMPQDTLDIGSESQIEAIAQELQAIFKIKLLRLKSEDVLFAGWLNMPAEFCIAAFFIENTRGEHVKQALLSFFEKQKSSSFQKKARVLLSNYGVLLPMWFEVKCHSFAHGQGHYYRYRVAIHKLNKAPRFLRDFLLNLPSCCPNDLFVSGPRGSNFKITIEAKQTHVKEHPCIDFAKAALEHRKFKSAHEDVEKYMIENDPECIATEVPIWLEHAEMDQFGWASVGDGCLTGHIDILRYEDEGMVGIWDFKPGALDANDARMQVYLYALMLSIRTGIPLNHFRCGYFDGEDAFIFLASQIRRLFPGER